MACDPTNSKKCGYFKPTRLIVHTTLLVRGTQGGMDHILAFIFYKDVAYDILDEERNIFKA